MIYFQILENGETKYLSWAKLCKLAESKYYMPSTWELLGLKKHFAEERGIPLDDVQVLMHGSAIL
tara:strand:- start:920 stop:1114 length:195 start_codon:yes stop_codon:yes gene_type:complete